jgi:glutamate-ammonia-ligase adenylyltransferase
MSASPPELTTLVEDRAAGGISDVVTERVLSSAGFGQLSAAREALDQILEHRRADVDPAELLAGCAEGADPDRALYNAGRLMAAEPRPSCRVESQQLGAFLGASQHMADLLIGRPALLEHLGLPFDAASAPERYRAAAAEADAEQALRLAQQEDLLAVAWADIVDGLDVEQVTILLSRQADALVTAAAESTGAVEHFGVLALGKLGGLELNYSSDIDLLFVRPDDAEDQVAADDAARRLLRLVGRQTADGHLYRVDMRLRPEGGSGVLTRTVSSCLDYYRGMGRPWERQMLTKGRVVVDCRGAGDEFLQGTRAWILECGLDAGAVLQFKRLKRATEARSAGDVDVKQAPGGIRDIETIVQFLALAHAASNPWLICNSSLHGIERLRVGGVLTSMEATRLRQAYLFHRRVENLLQVMHRVQTHHLPADRHPLSQLMRRPDLATFDSELEEHRRRVRTIFEHHFENAFPATEGPASDVSQLILDPDRDVEQFEQALEESGLADGAGSRRVLERAAAPVSRFLPESRRQVAALANLAPALLERLVLAADPDGALDRFERMSRGVGAREVLYTRLRDDPPLLGMLCDLAGGSPHLADGLAAEPELFDAFQDAVSTGTRGRRQRRTQLIRRDAAHTDPWLELADYHRIETLRIAVRDLAGDIPTPAVLSELSHLCIDILRHGYELVLAEAVREHGVPTTIRGVSATGPAHMVILALGKVGGLEANYGSDADIVFVSSGDGETDRGVPNSVFFSRVAEELIAHMGGARGGPRLYKLDTRLRPEGVKGPLVTTLRAFNQYFSSSRAALFEHQALLKARIVAGDAALGQKVLQTIRKTLRTWTAPDDLVASMRDMRGRIEAKAVGHDLKRGTGGMVDIEQLAQTLQLAHMRKHPSLMVQETPRALEVLADEGLLGQQEAAWLVETYLFFRRVETRLQIALGADTKEVPAEGWALRSLALRLGYVDSSEGDAGHLLLGDLEEAAAATRSRYEGILDREAAED